MAMVILIRHGRSTANAAGVLAGRSPGVGLDDHGQAQARQLADVLRDVDAAYSSPMERCRQTAALAGFPEARIVDGINECDYGAWTGGNLDDLAQLGLWAEIQRHPSLVAFPDGETMLAMRSRVVDAVRDIVERHPGQVTALFSHGDPIKAAIADALSMPFDEFQRLDVAPGSLSIIDYSSTKPVVRMVGGGPGAAVSLRGHGPTVGGGVG